MLNTELFDNRSDGRQDNHVISLIEIPKMIGDCRVVKFHRRSVDGKDFKLFQRGTPVF